MQQPQITKADPGILRRSTSSEFYKRGDYTGRRARRAWPGTLADPLNTTGHSQHGKVAARPVRASLGLKRGNVADAKASGASQAE